MLKIEIPDIKKTIELPNSWEELTYEQFLAAVSMLLINSAMGGSELSVKIELLKIVVDYKETKQYYSAEDQEQISGNLAIMATAFDFLFKDGLPDFTFRKFLSPDFDFDGKPLKAPFFEIQNTGADVVVTDISASAFTDAWEYYNLYTDTNNFDNLRQLAAILYTENEKYNAVEITQNAKLLQVKSEVEIYAIFLQFKSIIDYVIEHPAFGILFNRGKKKNEDKISLGFGGQIYTLSQKGFGDVPTLSRMPFTDFLAMLLDMLINDVRTMKAYDMRASEIAKKTELPLTTINRML